MSSLTSLDIVTLLLVVGAGVLGGMRGFVGEVLSLFAWVAAVIALKLFFAPVADGLTHVMKRAGLGDRPRLRNRLSGRVRRRQMGCRLDLGAGAALGDRSGRPRARLRLRRAERPAGRDVDLPRHQASPIRSMPGDAKARPAWIKDSRSYPLLDVTGRAIVNYVEQRRHAQPSEANDPAARHHGAREARFRPREPDRVTMYACGPTVYSRAHIGNARPAVVFDLLARLIEHVHPQRELHYARNFTDVDDKIIAAAAERGSIRLW